MTEQIKPDPFVYLQGEAKAAEPAVVTGALAPVVRTYEELADTLREIHGVTKVATSGFFNPLHKNHISNIVSSKQLPEVLLTELGLPSEVHLTVVVNGEWSTRQKLGDETFLTAEERADVVRALCGVDLVFVHEVEVAHQGDLIGLGLFDIFTKGGDRDFASLPEAEQSALFETGTVMVGDVGFAKLEGTPDEVSSSRVRARVSGSTTKTQAS